MVLVDVLLFLLQCRFTMFHILFLKVTEYAFENQLAELEQVPLMGALEEGTRRWLGFN